MQRVAVRPICALTELEPLLTSWESLAHGIPFREPTWLLTWWRHYGSPSDRPAASQLFVLVIEDEGRLIGLAPWYVERSWQRGKVVRALGSGIVCTDYSTILCEDGREADVAAAVSQFLCGKARGDWDRIELD